MKNIYENFQAELRLENGEFLAEGTASVDLEDKSVNFTSEFVPLYEVDTKAQICRIHNKQDVHKFNGQVYISDRNIMRIVSVTDELLEGSEDCYSNNVKCKTTIVATKSKDSNITGIEILKGIEFDATICDMTEQKVEFELTKSHPSGIIKKILHNSSKDRQKLAEGQIFEIKKAELPVGNISVKINKVEHFEENSRIQCDIITDTTPERDNLKEFLWAYNLQNNKLF